MPRRLKPREIKPSPTLDGPVLVGRNVRLLRKALGWSQEVLAVKTGLHLTYINEIERGKRNVGVKNVCALASGLGRHPRDLFADVVLTVVETGRIRRERRAKLGSGKVVAR